MRIRKKLTTGKCMKFYRKNAGLEIIDVADKLGVTQHAVWNWERDESKIDVFNFKALMGIYDVTMDQLLGLEQPVLITDDRYLDAYDIAEELEISPGCVHVWYRKAKGGIRRKKKARGYLYNIGDCKNYICLCSK